MKIAELDPHDMYAIAAQTQRTPGFGFDVSGVVRQRGLEYASIFSRFCAALIDGLVVSFATLLIVLGLIAVDHSTGGSPDGTLTSGTLLITLAASLVFAWLYYVCQETSGAQATLGKRLLGIKVAKLSGDAIGVPQSTIRFLVKMAPGANPILGLISLVADIFCLATNSSKNRTLHDLIAGTVVINA